MVFLGFFFCSRSWSSQGFYQNKPVWGWWFPTPSLVSLCSVLTVWAQSKTYWFVHWWKPQPGVDFPAYISAWLSRETAALVQSRRQNPFITFWVIFLKVRQTNGGKNVFHFVVTALCAQYCWVDLIYNSFIKVWGNWPFPFPTITFTGHVTQPVLRGLGVRVRGCTCKCAPGFVRVFVHSNAVLAYTFSFKAGAVLGLLQKAALHPHHYCVMQM